MITATQQHAFGRIRVWGTFGFLAMVVGFPAVLDWSQKTRPLPSDGPAEIVQEFVRAHKAACISATLFPCLQLKLTVNCLQRCLEDPMSQGSVSNKIGTSGVPIRPGDLQHVSELYEWFDDIVGVHDVSKWTATHVVKEGCPVTLQDVREWYQVRI